MKLYQVVCEDYKQKAFIVRGNYWQAKHAVASMKRWEKTDTGLTHKVYRLVIFKIGRAS